MQKKKIRYPALLLVCMLALLAGTVSAGAEGRTDWANGMITMTGYGVAPSSARTYGQARIQARRAAFLDACRNLAEYVQGIQVTSDTTVRDMAVESDVIQTHVTALVRGAKIVSETADSDTTYEVTIQVPMFGTTDSLAKAVLTPPVQKEAFPAPVIVPSTPAASAAPSPAPADTSTAAPVPSTAVNLRAVGSYTGLVVDCRGLGLKPVMSPVIKNEQGQWIYGYKNLDYAKVIANGMAGYTSDINGTVRAGSHPLVVKAAALDEFKGNPVLATADANRVLAENQASGFLDNCAVVFVR